MPSQCNPVKEAESSADKHCDTLNYDGKSRKRLLSSFVYITIRYSVQQLEKCRNFGILITAFLRFFSNFAVLFTKSGE